MYIILSSKINIVYMNKTILIKSMYMFCDL